jgi:hypothetical protein
MMMQLHDHADEQQGSGDERVDAALDRLATLDALPLAAQVTVFDDVHRLLQDALTGNETGDSEDPGR